MPKLNSLPTDYYTLHGGIGYNAILEHFKHQAEGQAQSGIVLTSGGNNRNQSCKDKVPRLRLVKVTSADTPKDPPKVDVVDPNEAMKNRATAELKREISNNTATPGLKHQSTSKRGRRKNPESNTTAAAANKAVKRARDVFDP